MCGGMRDFLGFPKCKERYTWMQITHISFSGAGMSGLAYLGVLRYLQMEQFDVKIHSLVGTSMGALFACIMALGIPVGTIEEDMKEFAKNPKNMFFEASDLIQMFHRFGIEHASMLTIILERHFMARWGKLDVTFLEFAKSTGKDLVICASCLETSCATFFSVNTTPHVSVITSIQASMAVPMLFFPIEIDGKHYVDGGATETQSVDCFGEKARDSMLAIKVGCQNSIKCTSHYMDNFVSYMSHLLAMMFAYWDRQYQKSKYSIVLDDPPVDFLPCQYSKEGITVKITDSDIDVSIEYGFRKAYEILQHERSKQASELLPSKR